MLTSTRPLHFSALLFKPQASEASGPAFNAFGPKLFAAIAVENASTPAEGWSALPVSETLLVVNGPSKREEEQFLKTLFDHGWLMGLQYAISQTKLTPEQAKNLLTQLGDRVNSCFTTTLKNGYPCLMESFRRS